VTGSVSLIHSNHGMLALLIVGDTACHLASCISRDILDHRL
jgi:hypothetical protein